MVNNYNKAIEILKKYNQEDTISFIKKATPVVRDKIVNQILNIDFDELKELYNKTFEEIYVDLEELHPIIGVNPDRLSEEDLNKYEQIGSEIIKKNKFAVATMAGGQGTRLRASKC